MSWIAPLLLSLVANSGPVDPPTLAFRGVTLVDGRGGPPLADATVVVAGGRIAAVGPSAAVIVPAGARVVEGAGKTLIPGLWDMHVHCADRRSLGLFLANGVTGVRVMWGNPSFGFPMGPYHFNWRRDVAEGRLLGPRLVVASNILDGPRPIWPGSIGLKSAEEGRKAVRDAKAAGADFVKVYSLLPEDIYMAIADESKKVGIPYVGHVPSTVDAAEASAAGQRSMEHLYGVLAGCTGDPAGLARLWAGASKGSSEMATLRPAVSAVNRFARETYSPEAAARLFRTFKANGTHQCPTLTVLRSIGSMDDPSRAKDDRLKYVDAMTKLRWDPRADFRFAAMTKADRDDLATSYRRALRLVGDLDRAGVPILAGTDELNPYIYPGFSLHDELSLLVEAGLSPMGAIQAATLNPARFFGRERDMGTVEAGKLADLVLLDADPLADIRNTTKIRAVVADGKLLDRASLDAMLAAAEAAAADKRVDAPALPGGYCVGH